MQINYCKTIPITDEQRLFVNKVYQEVAGKYNVDIELMRSDRKPKEVVRARFIAWRILKTKHKWTHSMIARVCKKNRATVIYGLRKIKRIKL